jgi:septum formation protein
VTAPPRFVLASASPARRRLLDSAGVAAEVVVSQVDEDALSQGIERPTAVAQVLAVAKARDVADRLRSTGEAVLVLGCDSVLEMPDTADLAGRALGKPADPTEAVRRWRAMRGNEGLLHTGHCLIDSAAGQEYVEVATTRVAFAEPTDDEIAAYVATGEPLRVAGAFTLDGLGGPFVRGVVGDPSNVIGLSLPLLRLLLARAGVPWHELWRTAHD